jgi:exonuclease SbcC
VAASSAVAAAQVRLDAAQLALTNLGDELREAAAGYPSVAARIKALELSASRALELVQFINSVDAAAVLASGAARRATAEAVGAGFDDLAEARAAIQPVDQLAGLRALVGSWAEEAAALRGAVAAEEFAGLLADEAAASARFDAARAEVESAQRDYDELADEAAPVVHLAKLAKGMSGNRRVNLTTYVLRQWFEQVVAAANLRLAGMSSGRFELVRVDEGGNKAERTGLTLQVLDRHTGEQRSTRSLSGGETFYTSLALALGLADVVRAEAGGVELDTLFIDEGFGSLDADTLDQVMEVIDELRTRGRTVGIVSHVAELKHRIAERIEVRRLPDGSSTLRVVA